MNKTLEFLIAIPVLALIFSGCQKEEDGTGADTNATFRISITSEGSDFARGAVICSSKDAHTTWLAFCTDELDAPVADLVALKIVELQSTGTFESSLQYGNKPVSFTGLQPKTEYKAIVAGVLSDGTVYGNPVAVTFTTDREMGVIELNPDWIVSYDGRDIDSYFTPYDIFHVESSASSDEKFFTSIREESIIAEFNNLATEKDIRDYIEMEVLVVKEQIVDRYQVAWDQLLFEGTSDVEYDMLEPGDYYMTVIGMTDDGEYTGLYTTKKLNIPEPKGSAGYTKWLGTWECRDAENTVNTITVIPAIGDMDAGVSSGNIESAVGFYRITGWQSVDGWYEFPGGLELDLSLTAYYVPQGDTAEPGSDDSEAGAISEALFFYGYDISPVQFSDGYGYVGFYGSTPPVEMAGEDGNPVTMPIAMGGPLAGAAFNTDGTAEVTGVEIQYEDAQGTAQQTAMVGMEYMYAGGDSMVSVFETDVKFPAFPFTMTKVSVSEDNAGDAYGNVVSPASLLSARMPLPVCRTILHQHSDGHFLYNPSASSYRILK